MRRLLLITLALAALLAGPACTRQDKDALRFRYWGDLEEIKIIEGLLRQFEAENPGIKVKGERKNPDASYSDVLLQEFAAGAAPDVFFCSTDNIDTLALSGKLADLSSHLAADPELKASDFFPLMINRFSSKGRLLALPRDISPVAVIYYNKALFDAAKVPYPEDHWGWEEFRAVARKLTLKNAEGKVTQYGFADDFNLSEAWVLAAGGRMVDDLEKPGRISCASAAVREGVLFRWKLMHQDRVMPSSNADFNGGNMALFQNGKLAMFHSGLWKVPSFRQIKDFPWDVARFPLKKGAKNAAFVSGGSGYAMRQDSKLPEAGWKLIRFMAGPEGQRRIAATGLSQPALRALCTDPAFLDGKDPKNKKMLNVAAEKGLASPRWLRWREFLNSYWVRHTDPIWLDEFKGGEAGVIEALERAEKEGNAKLF
jgi:multiple sugar transport system substrate-binding protein